MSKEAQNVKPAQTANTPPSVIANAARFNKQFLDSQLGGNLLTELTTFIHPAKSTD